MNTYRNQSQGYKRQPDFCPKGDDPLEDLAPGMAYVPWQNWNTTYEIAQALHRGTIFPELDKPFCG